MGGQWVRVCRLALWVAGHGSGPVPRSCEPEFLLCTAMPSNRTERTLQAALRHEAGRSAPANSPISQVWKFIPRDGIRLALYL